MDLMDLMDHMDAVMLKSPSGSIWSIKCRLLTKTEFQAGNHCELLPQTAGEALFLIKL